MLKYLDSYVTLAEVPDEISLCINLVGCNTHCQGCHSPWLWDTYKGEYPNNLKPKELTIEELEKLIKVNEGVSCVCIMGGDYDIPSTYKIFSWLRENTNLKTAWYSGQSIRNDMNLGNFDYIKTGFYWEEKGPLNSPNTNQRFYKVSNYKLEDITFKFRKHES